MIAREMARIDAEARNPPGSRQLHHAVVMTRRSFAPGLPSVHPLAVVVVFAGNEAWGMRLDQTLFGRKPLVTGRYDRCAQARIRKVMPASGQLILGCGNELAEILIVNQTGSAAAVRHVCRADLRHRWAPFICSTALPQRLTLRRIPPHNPDQRCCLAPIGQRPENRWPGARSGGDARPRRGG